MQFFIQLDEQAASSFYAWVATSPALVALFKVIGVGAVYLVPLVLAFAWFVVSRKTALRAALTGLIAWEGLNKLVAGLVDRPRPSMSQIGIKEIIFHRPDTSFPSDHSAFLMALTTSFYLSGQRPLGHLCLALSLLVGVARVGIGAHFPADILAGWVLGGLVAYLIKMIQKPLDDYIIEPIIGFLRTFKL